MTTELIQACPYCDAGSTAIYRRLERNVNRRDDTPDGQWYCRDCKQAFDEPRERERKQDGNVTVGVARALSDADPSDLGGDPA
jgi:hypothetical protein